MNTIENILKYTQNRLNNWYKDAKEFYGITGSAEIEFNKDKNCFVIFYEEDGLRYKHENYFYNNNDIDYVFNVWMEGAGTEKDLI